MNTPTDRNVRKARKQSAGALEQARTPLYAVLGAGDLASEAVRDYVAKARSEANDQAKDVQVRVNELQAKLTELQGRLVEVRTQMRAKVNELPEDVAGLRDKLEPGELRGALENYVQSLQDLYERLATRGESTVGKIRHQPQVKKAIDRVEGAADTTEVRVSKFVEDARELTFQVLGRVSRRTRLTGEKVANRTEAVADEAAGAVVKAGDRVAGTAAKVGGEAAGAVTKAGDEAAGVVTKVGDKAAEAATTAGDTAAGAATKTGDKAAGAATKAGDEAAGALNKAGSQVASTTRGVTRKATTTRTQPASGTTKGVHTRTTSTTRKNPSTRRTGGTS